MPFIEPIRNFYTRFERPISSFSLVAGSVVDWLTLRRADALWETLWIVALLIIVGVFIILIHRQESGQGDEKNPNKAHFWYVNILQFFFGGLLSAFIVFYFRSSDIFTSWPFILILAVAFIANEAMKSHHARFSFQISLLFLSIYSFAIYILPIIFNAVSTLIFLLSGLASLVLIGLFILMVTRAAGEHIAESGRRIYSLVLGIFVLVNICYFTNLIPPLPLALKDAGVFHSIQKNSAGNYEVTYENHGWRDYFTLFPVFMDTSASPVYVFTAVFSPPGFKLRIIHEWQRYDEDLNEWQTASVIPLDVVGGKGSGFRTYSQRSSLPWGKWRVNVKTVEGKVIGSVRFKMVQSLTAPPLQNGIK